MESSSRFALVALIAAWATSVGYIFYAGVDWSFTVRSGTLPSLLFTGAILSICAAVPYLILLPIARRATTVHAVFIVLAVLGLLAIGAFWMNQGKHTPGDEGRSFIVVPLRQSFIACLLHWAWRRLARNCACQ